MNWAIYDPLTGRITMVRRRSSTVPPRTGALSRMEVPEGVHPDTHYIDGASVRERPLLPVRIDQAGDRLTIAGTPKGAEVCVEGADEEGSGQYKIRAEEERHVYIRAFPYRDFYQNLAPGIDRRGADLAKISDPDVRDFLEKYVR